MENALTHWKSRRWLAMALLSKGGTPMRARLRSIRRGHERSNPYPPHCSFDFEQLEHAGKARSHEIFRSALFISSILALPEGEVPLHVQQRFRDAMSQTSSCKGLAIKHLKRIRTARDISGNSSMLQSRKPLVIVPSPSLEEEIGQISSGTLISLGGGSAQMRLFRSSLGF